MVPMSSPIAFKFLEYENLDPKDNNFDKINIKN